MLMENILDKFFDNHRLVVIPRKLKSKMLVFQFLSDEIAKCGNQFSEAEVNQILQSYYDDYAILRRYLVDYGFLSRDSYGTVYTVTNKETK
ncbi:DUF2087 domain-containing protein [Streptococcus sp. zg-JUN1979]|uniref:DUF2087 domain-containing protein n=1 Tax=Streptococcus sp. zg-JUN1979 TaxID=3391450 RepID=UPI0039A4821D